MIDMHRETVESTSKMQQVNNHCLIDLFLFAVSGSRKGPYCLQAWYELLHVPGAGDAYADSNSHVLAFQR